MSGLTIIGHVVLGGVGDRIGNRQVFIIGFALLSGTLLWLLLAIEIWKLYLFASIFGLAFGGCSTSESPLAARLFGLRSHGSIYGVLNLSFTIGSSIGPFLMGYIYDITQGYHISFMICAGVAITGAILSARLRMT